MPGESARKQAEHTVGRTEDDEEMHNHQPPQTSPSDAARTQNGKRDGKSAMDTTTDTNASDTGSTGAKDAGRKAPNQGKR